MDDIYPVIAYWCNTGQDLVNLLCTSRRTNVAINEDIKGRSYTRRFLLRHSLSGGLFKYLDCRYPWNVIVVKHLLKAGCDMHVNEGYPLRCSLVKGDYKVAKALLKAGVKIDGHSLIYANKYPDIIKLLLDAGADVHLKNGIALREAARNGQYAVVKILIDAGAEVHAYKDEALSWAAKMDNRKTMRVLIDAGADVHACNHEALRMAAYYGCERVVKILVDAGAYSDRALQLATERGHKKIVEILKVGQSRQSEQN